MGRASSPSRFAGRFAEVARHGARRYGHAVKLLQQAIRERAANDECERTNVRALLRAALTELLPVGSRVWIYGSLAKPGRFREWSDIDLAIEDEPRGVSIWLFMSLLAERTGRPVDVAVLSETRLRETILREGEAWTL